MSENTIANQGELIGVTDDRDPLFTDEKLTEEEFIAAKKAQDYGWSWWKKVTGFLLPNRSIYRAACPNYKKPPSETSQNLSQKAIESASITFLTMVEGRED